jgi:hypothetical protein
MQLIILLRSVLDKGSSSREVKARICMLLLLYFLRAGMARQIKRSDFILESLNYFTLPYSLG